MLLSSLVLAATGLFPFYPEISPNSEHLVRVSDLHQIHVASYGNKNGIPVITLHGGPGSCTSPFFAQFFDPAKYHIILADQRGAGKSLPKGEMRENTTQDLIADIEKIREFFKIKKWVVFGGSWGSTLALLYAEAHPEQVLGLILRGIFLAREYDCDELVRDGSPAAIFHSREWEQFKADTTDLINQAALKHLSVKTDRIFHIYYELLNQPNQEIREYAAGTLATWEKFNSYLEVSEEELNRGRSPDGVNMGLTEATYFKNSCFIRPNQILDEIERLKGIPVYIAQGKYDLVCPPNMADVLETALRKINNVSDLVVRYNCLAGHASKEPALRHGLIMATNHLAERLQVENCDHDDDTF